MIPVTQTKVVVRNSKDEMVVRGNCYAAAIASILERPICEVPNVETLFHIEGSYWFIVMQTFLKSIGWQLCADDRYKIFHPDLHHELKVQHKENYNQWFTETYNELYNKFYFVSGKSKRGVSHICIYKNGQMVHDPHPTKEGIETLDEFEVLEKLISTSAY